MPNFVRVARHPEWYHGQGKKPPFFEGWYFKLIDSTETQRYAVIPGIFLNADPQKQHAFVQVLDGVSGRSAYFRYPAAEFESAREAFDIRVGPNHFCADRLSLSLDGPELALHGDVFFQNLAPWPVTLISPGIMGWYAWVPFMECYHGVVSLDHTIQGSLSLDGQSLDLGGGRGYTEKDWGQSFPSAWIWTQTNHFEQPGSCLTASIALIPWIGHAFPGFIIGFWHERRLYRFATYTGARVERLQAADNEVTWVVRDDTWRLEMLARRSSGGLLHSPSRTEMQARVQETLQATVEVRLSDLRAGRTLFHGTGRNAGLEVQGDTASLRKRIKSNRDDFALA